MNRDYYHNLTDQALANKPFSEEQTREMLTIA